MRGNGDSNGIMEDEYTELELSDGLEIINWLAAQSWCDGKIGMMGISWGGFNFYKLQNSRRAFESNNHTMFYGCRYADDIHHKGDAY